MSDPQINTTKRISESADKIVLTTRVKRGTDTRDQDEIKVKIKGDDPQKTVTKLNQTVNRLSGTAKNLRRMQPEGRTDD